MAGHSHQLSSTEPLLGYVYTGAPLTSGVERGILDSDGKPLSSSVLAIDGADLRVVPIRQRNAYAFSLIRNRDLFLLFLISVMVLWPWIFLGAVFRADGLEIHSEAANYITAHPQATNFLVTLIGNLICFLVNFLFSVAITRYGQEWIKDHDRVLVFHVSVFSALRYQNWPWSLNDMKRVLDRERWLRVIVVAVCISAFAFVPSSTTSLINPVHFNRTAPLFGTELDFSTSAPECLDWYNSNPILNNCDWAVSLTFWSQY